MNVIWIFAGHGHAVVPSSPLRPENDPTTLFTSSGMQPMLPFFGRSASSWSAHCGFSEVFPRSGYRRGGDNRHTTFLRCSAIGLSETISREEQIGWMWEFLTQKLWIDPSRFILLVSGNTELGIPRDTEAAVLWQIFFEVGITASIVDFPEREGMQGGRIFGIMMKRRTGGVAPAYRAICRKGEPGDRTRKCF